ncbi:TetR family transcriptional regulator [Curtobacterium sp. PhB130]|uniref:TetR/AcrR family transcriptional regulator n=1 Tax=unclassified Curtobacterium TaxID=257496 RepID=UPI000F4BE66D|nr:MULTISPECIES: TetR/AcrR family transcriptional regulator [unclassified Curtobacterium]ROS77331.1 TetR family transcriptional regulator [Curtobacterium sp. PhB130]TCK66464.1 TetR family transcriptional regulator [Curtobacterium sp. PhB136]
MPRASLRDAIVDAALVEFHQHGYAGTGVAAITGAAGAPKGSFYNHFRSKADLAIEVADRFAAASPTALLDDESVPRAVDRITGYFDAMLDQLAGIEFRYGCLLGNLAIDTATDEPAVASHVDGVFDEWVARLAAAVRAAQEQGDVSDALDASLVGAQLVDLWEGAALRAKARRDGELTRRVVTDGVRRLLGL